MGREHDIKHISQLLELHIVLYLAEYMYRIINGCLCPFWGQINIQMCYCVGTMWIFHVCFTELRQAVTRLHH